MSKHLSLLLLSVSAGFAWIALGHCRVAAAAEAPQVGWDLIYSGSLNPGRSGEAPGKRFQVQFFVSDQSPTGQQTLAFLVQEEGQGGFLWPERFGTTRLSAEHQKLDNKMGAALLYDLEGQPNPVKLPAPIFAHFGRIKPDAKFLVGGDRFEVVGTRELRGHQCWQVEWSTDFGLKQVVWVKQDAPLVVGVDERVFMVGGQEFRLSMRLEGIKQLSADDLGARRAGLESLLALKQQLDRPDGSTLDTLNRRQLERSRNALKALEEKTKDTIYAPLVADIRRDVTGQLQREGDLESLVKERLGKEVPKFQLATLGRKTISSDDLRGKISILHFWDYRGEPFVEPYGQVGYLDFLYGKRRKQGVQVFGVAVHSRLGNRQEQGEPIRKIRKLRQFMNLSYPIGLDNGRVLRSFGDPRRVGGKLPLFVVVDAQGRITHFHTGFYKIKADEGLRPLDQAVDRALASGRSGSSDVSVKNP